MRKVKMNSEKLNSEFNFGRTANDEEITESTVEELARIAKETLEQNVKNAEWFDTIDIDEDSFKDGYYMTGGYVGADLNYKIYGTVSTEKFNIYDCQNPDWDGLMGDYSVGNDNAYALIDFVIDVHNEDMTMDFDNLTVSCFEWFDGSYMNDVNDERKFGQAFDVEKLSNKIIDCFTDAVYEVHIVVSNI